MGSMSGSRETDGGDLISFEEARDRVVPGESRLTIVRRGMTCRHFSTLVDPNMRTVECEKCGAELDPFEVVHQYALGERAHAWAKETIGDLRKSIHELKRLERNAKVRLKRLERKLRTT